MLPSPEVNGRLAGFRATPLHRIPGAFLPLSTARALPHRTWPTSLHSVFLACIQTPPFHLHVSETLENCRFVQGGFSHRGSGRPEPLALTVDLLFATASLSVGLGCVGICRLRSIVSPLWNQLPRAIFRRTA